jgi:serine/threonine-protein kinase
MIGGKYKVIAQIGKGGMATVYSAVHVGTDRKVALKVMSPESEAADCDASSTSDRSGSMTRFEREARIAGNLDTQHVTRVFDAGRDPVHGPFIAMELLEGDDLKDLIRNLGPLRPELALRIVAQACIGLARAHAIGVVHRDVKASNIFLAADEFGERVVKVLDFGIAKGRRGDKVDPADPRTLTRTGAMLGSPHYMSPEQVLGTKALDHRADIWSLGVLLYKCVSARTPFDDRDTVGQIIVAIVHAAPPSVQDFAPWVAPEVAQIIGRALKGPPAERFQSAQEMCDALRRLIPGGDLAITADMLTPMSDDERRDVKPRLSTRITVPDGTLGSRRLEEAAKAALAAAAPPRVTEVDSTIDPAVASFRSPSFGPRSLGTRVGLGAFALVAGVALVWGLTHRDGSPASAASAAPSAPTAAVAAAPAPPSTGSPDRHAPLQILPPVDAVDVDSMPVTPDHGTVDLVGELGSVHKVHLRAGKNEATVEVVVTEDGARPRTVSLPGAHAAAPVPARRGGVAGQPTTPSPAKSAARFDTQFE